MSRAVNTDRGVGGVGRFQTEGVGQGGRSYTGKKKGSIFLLEQLFRASSPAEL